MAFALVQAKYVADNAAIGGTTFAAAFDSNITAGNCVIGVSWCDSGAGPILSFNTASDTVVMVENAPNGRFAIFYIKSAVGGLATVNTVVTASGSALRRTWMAEFSGQNTSAAADVSDSNTFTAYGTGTDQAIAGPVTPSVNGELIVGWAFNGDTQDIPGLGTGFTSAVTSTGGPNNDSARMEYRVQSTAASISATFTVPGGQNVYTAMVAIKAAAAGGSVPLFSTQYRRRR